MCCLSISARNYVSRTAIRIENIILTEDDVGKGLLIVTLQVGQKGKSTWVKDGWSTRER